MTFSVFCLFFILTLLLDCLTWDLWHEHVEKLTLNKILKGRNVCKKDKYVNLWWLISPPWLRGGRDGTFLFHHTRQSKSIMVINCSHQLLCFMMCSRPLNEPLSLDLQWEKQHCENEGMTWFLSNPNTNLWFYKSVFTLKFHFENENLCLQIELFFSALHEWVH